jgi:hypothetical protein
MCRRSALPWRPSGAHGPGEVVASSPGRRRGRVAGLRARGAELVGELERYEDSYRLCYVRGPEGIIVELAEQIG